MRTLLTLDYEVFFGRNTGDVARTIIDPTDALLRVADRHGAKLVFFVDVGFILRLREEMVREPRLQEQHDAICRQIEALAGAGHEIQLHVHSHWEDSHWTGEQWSVDVSRYALQSFHPDQIGEIVKRYANELRRLAGPKHAFAFRAGGWLLQPFGPLRQALLDASVVIDSTIYPGGTSNSQTHKFDFRDAPDAGHWRFDTDPLQADVDGPFLEVPIAAYQVSPAFFWRLAWTKKFGGVDHRAFGDGKALPLGGEDLMRKLFAPSVSVVSIDGLKAAFLDRAAAAHRRRGCTDFVVIGHPKALTPYSLRRLDAFLAQGAAREVCTYAAYLPMARGQ